MCICEKIWLQKAKVNVSKNSFAGPMTVKVDGYKKADGAKISSPPSFDYFAQRLNEEALAELKPKLT